MRYLFAAGILATAEFAAPYPIQCCAGCPARPNLIMRVFSRKHVCTRSDGELAALLCDCRISPDYSAASGNMCLQARKHICKRASQSQTRCYPEAPKDVNIWRRAVRGSKKARLRENAQARDRAKQIACGRRGSFCVLTSEHASVLSCSRVRVLACYKALGTGGAG